MSFKDQIEKIKDNWLLIVLFVFGFVMVLFLISGTGMKSSYSGGSIASYNKGYASEAAYDSLSYQSYPSGGNSLAPNVLERIIVKTSSMTVVTEDFSSAEADLRSFIKSNDAIVTTENINTVYSKYKNGYFTINVPKDKYGALIAQLKGIGDVQSFNENANDITGSYLNIQDIIDAEKSRLRSYEELYNSTSSINEKKSLLDSIYSQKNNIRSLERQLSNQDERVDYSQITFNLQEKRPTHANVVFASFSDLWSAFKQSFNIMIYMIAYVLPFVMLWALIWWIVKLIRR